MKTILSISLFVLMGPGIAVAQTDTRGDASVNRYDRTDDTREHHNWSWIGLLGLVGLAGLRRKSEAHSRLEAQGVNVKTARV